MEQLTRIIQLAIGVQVVLSAVISIFIIHVNMKSRADFALFKIEMLATIDNKLGEYLNVKQFNFYSESHAHEHLDIHAEITRLRDFRHEINGEIHGLGVKIEDLVNRLEAHSTGGRLLE